MEWFNLAVDLLVPFIMIGFGWRFLKKPPQDIDGAFGYRTPMSMKNRDTWNFAHRTCGRVWVAVGVVMLPLAVLGWTRTLPYSVGDAGVLNIGITVLETVVLILTIIPVEVALSKRFDKHGNRK